MITDSHAQNRKGRVGGPIRTRDEPPRACTLEQCARAPNPTDPTEQHRKSLQGTISAWFCETPCCKKGYRMCAPTKGLPQQQGKQTHNPKRVRQGDKMVSGQCHERMGGRCWERGEVISSPCCRKQIVKDEYLLRHSAGQ